MYFKIELYLYDQIACAHIISGIIWISVNTHYSPLGIPSRSSFASLSCTKLYRCRSSFTIRVPHVTTNTTWINTRFVRHTAFVRYYLLLAVKTDLPLLPSLSPSYISAPLSLARSPSHPPSQPQGTYYDTLHGASHAVCVERHAMASTGVFYIDVIASMDTI